MAKLSILKRNGDMSATYPTYAAARAASVAGDVIQIWADLNEQIPLKDRVDIWIMPGVELNNTTTPFSPRTVTDSSIEVHCRIYGHGKITNTGSNGKCIFLGNSLSELSVECDYVFGNDGICIHISQASKFHLTCNYVYNRDELAILIGNTESAGLIPDLNLNISSVQTGLATSFVTGITAIITRANGFIKIDEILCRNLGHCLSHREGTIIATIKKLQTTNNYLKSGAAGATVHVGQYDLNTGGLGNQKIILYFDEILALEGEFAASLAIEHHEGTGIFIGRSVYSDSSSIQISKAALNAPILPKGYLRIDKIIGATGNALLLNDFTDQITIDADYIEGNAGGEAGAIYSLAPANFLLKNAKVVNKNTNIQSRGISLVAVGESLPTVELKDVKIVTSDTGGIPPYNEIIYINIMSTINIKNYNLIANRNIETFVNLEIGKAANYNFIFNNLLS